MSSGKWRPFCLDLNVLKHIYVNVSGYPGSPNTAVGWFHAPLGFTDRGLLHPTRYKNRLDLSSEGTFALRHPGKLVFDFLYHID